MRHQPTYQCWQDMKSRCYNPRTKQFKNYGARGIIVCERWLESYDNFLADMGEKPDGLTIDRIKNDGPYSLENCRWASRFEQSINRRGIHMVEINGQSKPLRHWAESAGMNEMTLLRRLRNGMPLKTALSKPVNQNLRASAMKGNAIRWSSAIALSGGEKT